MLNTKDHGIPQSRPRLYIVALLRSKCERKFTWPKPVPSVGLLRFLDANVTCTKASINDLGKTAVDNIIFWRCAKQKTDGIDILKTRTRPYVLDANAGKKFRHIMLDCSPCLTRARAQKGGHFVTALRRMMNINEIGRLQGCPTSVTTALRDSAASDEAVGAAFGDAMSINVLMRVVPRALRAVGLLKELPFDIWARKPPAQGVLPDVTYKRGNDVGDKL